MTAEQYQFLQTRIQLQNMMQLAQMQLANTPMPPMTGPTTFPPGAPLLTDGWAQAFGLQTIPPRPPGQIPAPPGAGPLGPPPEEPEDEDEELET